MATIKPTNKEPVSPQSEKFEKNFKKTMMTTAPDVAVTMNETDGLLSEVEQSLKKKIFSLAKMEALVFADPKLTSIYEEMAENGEEKYGYHYNETIQNMIFNDYVLNSPHYLQKYKMAIPKEKKRRDKSGINTLKKQGAEKMAQSGLPKQKKTDVNETDEQITKVAFLIHPDHPEVFAYFPEENYDRAGKYKSGYAHLGQHTSVDPNYAAECRLATPEEYQELQNELENQVGYNLEVLNGMQESTSAGSAGGAAGYVGYAGPAAWSTKGDLLGGGKKKGGGSDGKAKPISKAISIGESNYITDPTGFEKYVEFLNEESDAAFIARNGSNTYGSVDNMNPENQKIIKNDIQSGKFDNNAHIKDGIALQEKAKSKSQQQFMGMVHAYQKGDLNDNEVSDEVKKAAGSMSDKAADDFASTKHKNLPDHVDENPMVAAAVGSAAGGFGNAIGNRVADKVGLEEDMLNELSLHDTVEYVSDMNGENVFDMGGDRWQFVKAKYPDGKIDIGVYRFGQDLVYDYAAWREAYNINEDNIKEDTQTMIQNNGTSMSNKAQATGDMSSDTPMGTQASGGLNEDFDLLEDINKELEAFSVHHNKLKLMAEERKTTSQILNKRVTDDNPKNFKKDLQNSGVKQTLDVEKELEWADQQTDVGKDPQKLGQDIEKEAIKASDMKGDEALKNVGNSTNRDGDEIPKRNLTTKEQEEVDLYRNGLHSYDYDNEPSERFVERMKADQGEFFEMGEKQKEFKKGAPAYNKDTQPIEDGEEKMQFDKNVKQKGDRVAWNERMGLGSNIKLAESMVTGSFHNAIGERHLLDFKMGEVSEVVTEEATKGMFKLDFTGLGNRYNNKTVDKKVVVNEAVVDLMETYKFYTDGNSVVTLQNPAQKLNEEKVVEPKQLTEEVDKMKHLLGYKPEKYVSTQNVKKNRNF